MGSEEQGELLAHKVRCSYSDQSVFKEVQQWLERNSCAVSCFWVSVVLDNVLKPKQCLAFLCNNLGLCSL